MKRTPPKRRVTYDAGALFAAEAGDPAMWRRQRRLEARKETWPVVLTVVAAQALRGGSQPLLSRLLKKSIVLDFDLPLARGVGGALATSRTSDVVDAAVVLTALDHGGQVVTTDPGDLGRIANALGRRLDMRAPKRAGARPLRDEDQPVTRVTPLSANAVEVGLLPL